ncbi:MAG: NUDIX domain-containing protein [Candidatus Andersenbacteria bacterium]
MRHQIAATSAFIFHNGKALIALRAKNDDYLPDYWEQVGGKLDWGEHPEEGVAREVQEEAGLTVRATQFYAVMNYINEKKERHVVEIAYICEIVGSPDVTLSDEHQEYRWITREEVESVAPMSDEMREYLRQGFKVRKNGSVSQKPH